MSWRELTLGEVADLGIALRISYGDASGVEVRGYRGDLVIVTTVTAAEVEAQGGRVPATLKAIGSVVESHRGGDLVFLDAPQG